MLQIHWHVQHHIEEMNNLAYEHDKLYGQIRNCYGIQTCFKGLR